MPELGAGVVGAPEMDVGVIGDGGIGEVEATAIGVGDGVSVGSGVIGKGPNLRGGAILLVELDVDAIAIAVVEEVDDALVVKLRNDGVGAAQVRGGGSKVRGRDGTRAA